jgi:hypothetical protein
MVGERGAATADFGWRLRRRHGFNFAPPTPWSRTRCEKKLKTLLNDLMIFYELRYDIIGHIVSVL